MLLPIRPSHNRLREHSRTYISPETARLIDLRSESKIFTIIHKALHSPMPADISSFVTHELPFAQPTLQLPYVCQVPKQAHFIS